MSGDNSGKQRRSSRIAGSEELEARLRPKYKSQAERRIARFLNEYGIPFIYEKPVAVLDAGHTKIWHPDFHLHCGVVIEYFGINGNREYNERTKHKLKVYAENGINVIAVYPRELEGRWQRRLLEKIDKTLDRILSSYREAVGIEGEGTAPSVTRQYLELR